MSKVIQAFWEKHQVWPELCPKKVLIDGEYTYQRSCIECIIDGKLLCRPDINSPWRSPPANSLQDKKRRGRPMKGEWRCCPVCRSLFYVPRWRIDRGLGNYCSSRCSSIVKGCPEGVTVAEFNIFKRSVNKEAPGIPQGLSFD